MVEIGMTEEGSERTFFARGNGMGIAPRFHETVFGLFDTLDLKSEGSGAGLAVVRRIVDVHGGRIWVDLVDHPLIAIIVVTMKAAFGVGASLVPTARVLLVYVAISGLPEPGGATGPYRLKSRTPAGSIVLEAFKDYHGGRPPIDLAEYRIIPNPRERAR